MRKKKYLLVMTLILALVLAMTGMTGCSCTSTETTTDRDARDSKETDDEEDKDDEEGNQEDPASASERKEYVHREDTEACKETLIAFLEAYHSLDPTANQYLTNDGEEAMAYDGFQGMLAAGFTYEVGEVDMSNEVPYISLTITNIDFGSILETYFGSLGEAAISDEQIKQDLTALLQSEDHPVRTFECLVPVYYLDEASGLKIEMTQDLSNALTGGFAEFFSGYLWTIAGEGQ